MGDQDITVDAASSTGHRRRDVLLGATGIAAAVAATAALGEGVAHAGKAADLGPIVGEIAGLGQFEVLAYSWGASNSGSMHQGGGQGAGKANIQDLSLTKYVDASSPALFTAVATGTHFPTASVTFTAKKGAPVIRLLLREVLVTSMSTGGSSGEAKLTENVTLNFARVEYSVDGAGAEWSAGGGSA